MIVLGLETSCDETAVAIVENAGIDDAKTLRANIIWSQWEEHKAYGGVVPEIAARAHQEKLPHLLQEALHAFGGTLADIDAIAATCGPGLIGGVIVGCMWGKGLASSSGKPFYPINHLEGHALTARLTHTLDFPYLLLLASGGHCQFLLVRGVGNYQKLGGTVDDALGEAFDKCAKLLGLGHPGGPKVEQAARTGDASRFALPVPMNGRAGCDFSFSGLKTAVRTQALALRDRGMLDEQTIADLCASFQFAACASVRDRTLNALAMANALSPGLTALVAAGGVAANQRLRECLQHIAAQASLPFIVPEAKLCTDNAAMIAWAGIERIRAGAPPDLSFNPRARWPLEETRI